MLLIEFLTSQKCLPLALVFIGLGLCDGRSWNNGFGRFTCGPIFSPHGPDFSDRIAGSDAAKRDTAKRDQDETLGERDSWQESHFSALSDVIDKNI